MKTLLIVLVGLAMLGTLGVLLAGMLGLARQDGDAGQSNTLMRWRVILQGITVALFVLLLIVSRG